MKKGQTAAAILLLSLALNGCGGGNGTRRLHILRDLPEVVLYIPNRLVRAVFELKLMEINGEYMEKPLGRLEDSTIYTWEYVLASPVEKLYTFTVTEKVLEEFTKCVAENKRRFVDKTFHSLDILDVLVYK